MKMKKTTLTQSLVAVRHCGQNISFILNSRDRPHNYNNNEFKLQKDSRPR